MKRFIILCALVFVGAFGWQLGAKLSADALSMGIGIFFGVLASVPAALLVLAASRRGDRSPEHERRPHGQGHGNGHGYQSPVIVVAPPMHGYPQMQSPQGIPNLAGIKFTNEDFMDFQSCISFMDGKYDMLWGRDENLLSALVLGTRSGVGSTYNYAAPLYYKLIAAFDAGDLVLARQLQQKAIDMIRLLGKYGGIATGKAFMRYVGLKCGEFRSPIKNMSRDDYRKFTEDVKTLGMEEEFSKYFS